MSVDNQKSMSGDAAQSKLDTIRARFQARSEASVDAALQVATGGSETRVNPNQDVLKAGAPSVDASTKRAPRRKAGADRAGRAKRTGKGAAAPLLKAAESQATQTEDPLLDKLTDLLSSPDSGTPATPEPTVAATTGMDAMPDEDRMAAGAKPENGERTRERLVYLNDFGEYIYVGREGDRYFLMNNRNGRQPETYTLAELEGLKRSGGWTLQESGELGEVVPDTQNRPSALEIDPGRDPLLDMRPGDVWVLRNPQGQEVNRVTIEYVQKDRKGKKVVETVEFFDQALHKDLAVPLATFLEELRNRGYQYVGYIPDESLPDGLPEDNDEFFYKSASGETWRLRQDPVNRARFILIGADDQSQSITDAELRRRYREEKWRFEKKDVVQSPVNRTELPQAGEFVLPQAGEMLYYQGTEGRLSLVLLSPGLYQLTNLETNAVEGEYDADYIRSLAASENWVQFEPKPDELALDSPEASRQELVGPPTLNEALAKVEEAVAQTRKQLVEVEFEQKKQEGVLKGIRRVLGTLVGKDIDLGPQVTERRVEYQANLAQLLNLRIESLKRQKLEGKKLREEIAGLSREFEFEEGERLDDARYQIRLGEDAVTLKEKWHKVLEGAKRSENIYTPKDGYSEVTGQKEWYNKWALVWGSAKYAGEVVGRGVRVTGETYNKITKTRTGKMVTMAAGAAGAATLAFASGGAVLGFAGVAMAAKRAAAGAGVALAAEEGMGMVARGYRDREATKNTESMLERLEARGVIGSDEGWDELLHTLSQRNIDGLVDRDLARQKWALRRKAIAMFGGTLMGTGAAAQLIGIGVQEAREAVSGSGAVDRVAARLGDAASAPSPAAAASAAEASASAPSGSASAAAGAASASPLVESGKVEGTLRTSYSRGIDEVLDRARAESLGKVLFETRTIASGDTIWKYGVEAAKTAGLDEAGQKRFSVALTQALREKLSMMSPEEAAKYGFYPNKDGLLTPDYIRANDKLDLVGLLGQEKLAALVEQAETGGASGGAAGVVVEERATGVSSDGRVANMKDSIAWSKPDYGPGEAASAVAEEATSTVKAVVEAVDTRASLMTEFQSFKKGDILSYVQRLPREEQAEIFRTMRRTVGDLFNTPETSIYSDSPQAQYLFTDHPEFAKVSMSRVLEDHQTLSSKAFYMYDRTTNPLHWTQMQEMAKFAEAAEKTLDKKLAAPFKQESVDEYVLRMAAIARATGKTIPGLRMVN